MKKSLIRFLVVVVLLGGVTTMAEGNSSVSTTQVAQASSDTTSSQSISYAVNKSGTNAVDADSVYFINDAKIAQNDDGTYKITLTMKLPKLKSLSVTTIDGQTPVTSTYSDDSGTSYQEVSFNVNSLDDLNNTISGTLESKTKLFNVELTKSNLDFKFNTATATGSNNSRSTLLDNLKSITEADKSTAQTTDKQPLVSNYSSSGNVIIEKPTSTTTISKNNDGQSITYKVVKNDNSGSAAANYLTNTATITPNADGTYNIAMTIAYNKKLGDSAVKINMINNQTVDPDSIFQYTKGDNNYLKFNFNIDSLDDLSNLIPGQLSLLSPDYGLDSLLDFNLDFDGLSSLDLSNLVNTSDLSSMMNDLKNLSSDLKSLQNGTAQTETDASSANDTQQVLPKTGNVPDYGLSLIGLTLIVSWGAIIRTTYVKNYI